MTQTPTPTRTLVLTAITMVAFAANSLLCRMALGDELVDFASFTWIRFGSGAVTLALIHLVRTREVRGLFRGVRWTAVVSLVLYALPFAYAYNTLSTGTGALILFAGVQVTMTGVGIARGERPPLWVWIGMLMAVGGLVALVAPGLQAPDPVGAASMAAAGIGWGMYSIAGKDARDPASATARNFLMAVPVLVGVGLLVQRQWHADPMGVLWALLSGTVASGLGYVMWYAALKGLTAVRGAVVQLSVPVLAALGGVAVLHERLTFRLVACGSAILAGIAVSLVARRRKASP